MANKTLMTCGNCNWIVPSRSKSCNQCGAGVPSSSAHKSAQKRQYTYHIAEESDDDDDVDPDYQFPEVELTPPTVDELITSYTQTLDQLKAEKCVFFSLLFNRRNGKTVVTHEGFSEDIVSKLTDTAKVHLPKPNSSGNFRKRQSQMTAEELAALPYGCPECEYRTKNAWVIKHHMRQHTNEKPYKCPYCDTTFKDHCHMLKHRRKHETVTEFECDICHTYWPNARSVHFHKRFQHFKKTESGTGLNKCHACDKEFKSKQYLKWHIKDHHSDASSWLKCDQCDYATPHSDKLEKHKIYHQPGVYDNMKFKCAKCSFGSDRSIMMYKHISKHHGGAGSGKTTSKVQVTKKKKSITRGRLCYFCDFEAKNYNLLLRHLDEKHDKKNDTPLVRTKVVDGVEMYSCARCKHLTNSDRPWMESHVLRCAGRSKEDAEYKFHCMHCDYRTDRISQFERHCKELHGENCEVEFKCPWCDPVFSTTSKDDYFKHRYQLHKPKKIPEKRKTEAPPKPKKEKKVEKMAKWEKRRNRHKFKYKCNKCTFSAPSEVKLNHHKSFHEGNCFQCSWCSLVFQHEQSFKVHEARHLREEGLVTSKKEKGNNDTAPVFSVVSLASHSAGAIKNKYEGYRLFRLVNPLPLQPTTQTTPQTTIQMTTQPTTQPATQTPPVKAKSPVIIDQTVTSTADHAHNSTVREHEYANMENKSGAQDKWAEDRTAIPTYPFKPPVLCSLDKASNVGSSKYKLIAPASLGKTIAPTLSGNGTGPINTASANIMNILQSTPATVPAAKNPKARLLTPQDKRMVRNAIADLISSGDDPSRRPANTRSMQCRHPASADASSKAPRLAKLIQSNTKVKLKRLDDKGTPIGAPNYKRRKKKVDPSPSELRPKVVVPLDASLKKEKSRLPPPPPPPPKVKKYTLRVGEDGKCQVVVEDLRSQAKNAVMHCDVADKKMTSTDTKCVVNPTDESTSQVIVTKLATIAAKPPSTEVLKPTNLKDLVIIRGGKTVLELKSKIEKAEEA